MNTVELKAKVRIAGEKGAQGELKESKCGVKTKFRKDFDSHIFVWDARRIGLTSFEYKIILQFLGKTIIATRGRECEIGFTDREHLTT